MMERKYIDSGGILDYDPEFLSKDEADSLYDYLYSEANWEQKYFVNRKTGVRFPLTRLTVFYADNNPNISLSYSGITHDRQPWLPRLLEVKAKVEKVTGADYNSVLMNLYQNGYDSLGAHADSHFGVDCTSVAGVSLGDTRAFVLAQVRKDPDWKPQPGIQVVRDNTITYNVTHGSLLVMSGTTQEYWTHEIPKMEKVGPRMSLTFRKYTV